MHKVKIEVSARHIHLSKDDLDTLFGCNYELNVYKNLSQPGQFSAVETLNIRSQNGEIKNVRIVGPTRSQTQVELSITDCHLLKIKAPILVSGDLKKSGGGIKLIGPKSSLDLKSGVIVAQRHLHIEPQKAKQLKLKHGDTISIKINGIRSLIFNNIAVRSRLGIDRFALHLDTDEANAANILGGEEEGIIL